MATAIATLQTRLELSKALHGFADDSTEPRVMNPADNSCRQRGLALPSQQRAEPGPLPQHDPSRKFQTASCLPQSAPPSSGRGHAPTWRGTPAGRGGPPHPRVSTGRWGGGRGVMVKAGQTHRHPLAPRPNWVGEQGRAQSRI